MRNKDLSMVISQLNARVAQSTGQRKKKLKKNKSKKKMSVCTTSELLCTFLLGLWKP